MYFHISLIPSGAYFLLPLESKQEDTSLWNFTKCISEVKVNQLKVKNIHVKMGISTFKLSVTFDMLWKLFWCQNVPKILNNMLNLKCQFWYLPQRASLAHVGSQFYIFKSILQLDFKWPLTLVCDLLTQPGCHVTCGHASGTHHPKRCITSLKNLSPVKFRVRISLQLLTLT